MFTNNKTSVACNFIAVSNKITLVIRLLVNKNKSTDGAQGTPIGALIVHRGHRPRAFFLWTAPQIGSGTECALIQRPYLR